MTPEKITQNLNPEQHNTENVNDVQPSIENDREPIIVEDVQEELKQVRDNITGEEQQMTNDVDQTLEQHINNTFSLSETQSDDQINDSYITRYIKKIKSKTQDITKNVLLRLVDRGHEEYVIDNLHKFGLDNDRKITVINELIKNRNVDCVQTIIWNFDKFGLTDTKQIVGIINELMTSEDTGHIAYNFDKFGLTDTKQIVGIINELIKEGYGWDVILNSEHFHIKENEIENIFNKEVKKEMRKQKEEKYGYKLEQLSRRDELEQLIKEDVSYLILNFDKLKLKDKEKAIAIKRLVTLGYDKKVIKYFTNFNLTDTKQITEIYFQLLCRSSNKESLINNIEKFSIQPEKLYELVKNSAKFGAKIKLLEHSNDSMVLLEQSKKSPSLLTDIIL